MAIGNDFRLDPKSLTTEALPQSAPMAIDDQGHPAPMAVNDQGSSVPTDVDQVVDGPIEILAAGKWLLRMIYE